MWSLFQGSAPLPIDLGVIGAPGCFAQLSYDLDSVMFGSANVGSFNLPIPSASVFLGLPLYVQAAVLDSSHAFGFVLSDAWAARLGV